MPPKAAAAAQPTVKAKGGVASDPLTGSSTARTEAGEYVRLSLSGRVK